MTFLPDDVWHMICTELRHQRDSNTLLDCACTGTQLAPIALKHLYGIQNVAPTCYAIGDEVRAHHDESVPTTSGTSVSEGRCTTMVSLDECKQMKWACFWHTILLSCLGNTLYPYCQHIRTLNFEPLADLLVNPFFQHSKHLFQGRAAPFEVKRMSPSTMGYLVLDGERTIEGIGEAITKQNPLLEEIIGRVSQESLSRWIPRLPRLEHLKFDFPSALENNGNLVRLHCPSFKRLSLNYIDLSQSDRIVASFLGQLRPQSLESFEATDHSRFKLRTFQALSGHGGSLIELRLPNLRSYSCSQDSQLKGCTNLVSLLLGNSRGGFLNLFDEDEEDFEGMITWLKGCKNLQTLAFRNFPRASILLDSILSESGIQSNSFEYEDGERFNFYFLESLAHQKSLQSLHLKGRIDYPCEAEPEDVNYLLKLLSKLVNLTNLRVQRLFDLDEFQRKELATNLPMLQVWFTSDSKLTGKKLTGKIWGAVASVSSLPREEADGFKVFKARHTLGLTEPPSSGEQRSSS